MTLSLDQNGKLELPKAIREALHLEPGSQLYAQIEGEKLVLTGVKPAELKRVGKILMWTGEVDSSLTTTLETMRSERIEQVGGF
jgi:bifunctional DNA-binding transcriptional regulator/antitoxin component of YhaV-PrlF toxin-antitoxin module